MKHLAYPFMSLNSKFRTTCLATLEFKAPTTVNKVVLKTSSILLNNFVKYGRFVSQFKKYLILFPFRILS